MNHYLARQRSSDLRWEFSSANRREGTHPVGYCVGREFIRRMLADPVMPISADERARYEAAVAAGLYHEDGHGTAEEAAACYHRYLLDTRLRLDVGRRSAHTKHQCEARNELLERCPEFTDVITAFDQQPLFFCDAHRTREEVAKRKAPSTEIWSSW
jgi:hypothetical protein